MKSLYIRKGGTFQDMFQIEWKILKQEVYIFLIPQKYGCKKDYYSKVYKEKWGFKVCLHEVAYIKYNMYW